MFLTHVKHLSIFVIIMLLRFAAAAQCTNTGAHSAGTAASTSFPGSNFSFDNPGNIFSSDNSRASSAGLVTLFTGETEYLFATNFGFSIPPAAIICGIVVEVEKSATGIGTVLGIGLSYVSDYSVRLVRNGVVTGNNKASATHWTTSEAYHTYGGSNDIWGIPWTPADINASGFGIAFSASINGLAMLVPNVRLDHIRVTVYYMTTILPAHILHFDATAKDDKAIIEWKTSIDKHYSVQRSQHGKEWENISGDVQRSYQAGKYCYTMEDKQPLRGQSFYRLRISEASGEINYTSARAIRMESGGQSKVFPNPFTDRASIQGYDGEKIKITDMSGRSIPVPKVTTGILDLRSLKPGLYFVTLGTKTFKLQKQY